MQRIAFQLQLRPNVQEEYDRVHRHVWPELVREMESFGVKEYSIFRRDRQLFLYMRVPDFDRLLIQLEASEINQRWQRSVAHLFESVPDIRPDETFAMMEEVFYMPGSDSDIGGREG